MGSLGDAACSGDLAAVDRLLADPRVDPAAGDNFAVRFAALYGHVAVVDRLLADPRVDPAASNNQAVRGAASWGYAAVVDRLLADLRVDPSALDNAAVSAASSNRNLQVVERLLLEPCVVYRLRPEHVAVYAARRRSATPAALRAALVEHAWTRRRAAVLHSALEANKQTNKLGDVRLMVGDVLCGTNALRRPCQVTLAAAAGPAALRR